jgi:hypothetical protein
MPVLLNLVSLRVATILSSHIYFVGQDGILRPIGNRPYNFLAHHQADCQSAAGYQPAPHGSVKYPAERFELTMSTVPCDQQAFNVH